MVTFTDKALGDIITPEHINQVQESIESLSTPNGITTALGYTPVNKSGDTLSGALAITATITDPLLRLRRNGTGDYFTIQDSDGVGRFRMTSTSRVNLGYPGVPEGQLDIQPHVTTIPAVIARGYANQSANIQEWRDNTGAVLASVGAGGIVTAPLRDRGGQALNVRAYPGVVGDGVADDTAALQAVLDAVPTGGGTVVFPTGTYLTGRLRPKSRTILRTTGGAILRQRAGEATAVIEVQAGVTDVVIDGLEIDGNAANQTSASARAMDLYGSRITVADCFIHDTEGAGVGVRGGSSAVTIADNRFRTIGRQAVAGDYHETLQSTDVLVRGNDVDGTGTGALSIISNAGDALPSAGGRRWTFSDNIVRNAAQSAISAYSRNNVGVLVADNIVENAQNHGTHLGGTDVAVVGNIYRNCGTDAIYIANEPNGANVPGTDFLVADNIVSIVQPPALGITHSGILVRNYQRGTITGNKVYDTDHEGIVVEGAVAGQTVRSSDIAISGNIVAGTGYHGIRLLNVDRATVGNNTVTNVSQAAANTYDGIYITNDTTPTGDVLVIGNPITDAQATPTMRYGVRAVGTAQRVHVASNPVRGELTGKVDVASTGTTFGNPGVASTLNDTLRIRNNGADNALEVFDSGGVMQLRMTNTMRLVLGGSVAPSARLHVYTPSASNPAIVITSATAQSANLFEARNSANALLSSIGPDGNLNIVAATGEYRIAGSKVITGRVAGWAAPTGTRTRSAFDPATVTTAQLAERVAAILEDLGAGAVAGKHGLIGT